MSIFGESEMTDVGECTTCRCKVWVPTELYKAAKRSPNISFYCSFGHGMHYPLGDSEATKLRRERDRLAQQIAQRDDEIRRQRELKEAAERQASAARGQVTKLRNRVAKGVCPCCNRSFANLHRHMASQHPQFSAEAA